MLKRIFLAVAIVVMAAFGAQAAEISGVESLKGLKLAAEVGTTGHKIASTIAGGETKVSTYRRYTDAIDALSAGSVDAVIMDGLPAEKLIAKMPDLTIMPQPIASESYAFALKKGSTLTENINTALKAMKEEGIISTIVESYMSGFVPSPADIDLNTGAKGGKLVVGTWPMFAPYEMRVGSGYVGIDIEIMTNIAARLDRELVIEPMEFDELFTALESGKVNVIASALSVTNERSERVDFSDRYIENTYQVAVVRKSDLKK